jgi:hypothetical protein
MVYKVETGRTDFVDDWELKDGAVRHRTTTYIRTYVAENIILKKYNNNNIKKYN